MAWCSVKAQGQLYIPLDFTSLHFSIATLFHFSYVTVVWMHTYIYRSQKGINTPIFNCCSQAWYEVSIVVKIQTAVFWVMMPCSVVVEYQYFRGPFCLHLSPYELNLNIILKLRSTSRFIHTSIVHFHSLTSLRIIIYIPPSVMPEWPVTSITKQSLSIFSETFSNIFFLWVDILSHFGPIYHS